MRFKSNGNTNAPGWEAQVSCVPVCQQVIAVLDTLSTTPPPDSAGYIDICIGTPITFTGKGKYPFNNLSYTQGDSTSLLIWDFGDGTSDTGSTITHLYDSVMGFDVNLTIYDIHGCHNTNSIGIRVRISENPVQAISGIPQMCKCTQKEKGVSINSSVNLFYHPRLSCTAFLNMYPIYLC